MQFGRAVRVEVMPIRVGTETSYRKLRQKFRTCVGFQKKTRQYLVFFDQENVTVNSRYL